MTPTPHNHLPRRASVLAAAVLALLVIGPAQAGLVTIDFTAFQPTSPGSVVPFNGGTEDGFDLSTAGSLYLPNLNNLAPLSPLSGNFLSGLDDVTSGASSVLTITELVATTAFQFLGLDAFNNGNTGNSIDVTVLGFLNSNLVGTDVFDLGLGGSSASSYNTAALAGKSVDTLVINFGSVAESNVAFIDNIRLDTDPAAVPVPATALLLLSGLAGIGRLRRRRSAC